MDTPEPQDHASKLKGLAWLLGACLIGVVFAYGLAPLAHAIPWSWEKSLGARMTGESNTCPGTVASRAALQKMVARVYPVRHDDAEFSIDVTVSRDKTVNAFAMLGGHITLNAGLLSQARSAEEVAGILAHEIEHVRHRHIMQGTLTRLITVEGLRIVFGGTPTTNWTEVFLRMNFTRRQEAQADREGLKRLEMAQVDNTGFRNFFERMEDGGMTETFLSDHPAGRARAEMAGQFSNENATPVMSVSEWMSLKAYCK